MICQTQRHLKLKTPDKIILKLKHDSNAKRSLNLYFMNTSVIFTIVTISIHFCVIRPSTFIFFIKTLVNTKPSGLFFDTLEACKNVVFEEKAAKLNLFMIVNITLLFIQNAKLTFLSSNQCFLLSLKISFIKPSQLPMSTPYNFIL
jgi:hypothetical protein